MAAPEVWGPRLWRLLHGLADVSDRRDIYPLWNSFLKATALAIPCQKCQKHMQEYWMTHRFLPKDWISLRGAQVCAELRTKLHAFHNAVNGRLGKPDYPPLTAVNITDRTKHVQELQDLFQGLREEWGAAPPEWKQAGSLLLQLVKAGPT